MKAGWRVVPLSELCEFRRGLTYAKGDEVDSGGTAVLRAMNIDLETGELDLSDIRYIAPTVDVPKTKMVATGTLLICTASGSKKHLGKTALIDQPIDFAFGGFMGLLVPSKLILPKYLHWLMRSDMYWDFINQLSSGTNINNLKFSQLGVFPIPLPPLDEQKRIVAVLDEAFEGLSRARANAEANLADARELFRRCLEVDFAALAETHPRRTIAEVAVIKGGKRLPKGDSIVPTLTPYPYISIKDFNDLGSVDMASVGYLLPRTREAIKNYIIRSEDLYISIAGTIGKTGIVPDELDGANLTENAARMIFKEGVNNEYVYFFTLTDDFQEQAGLNTRTAAQPKLALERLKTITLPVAPLKTQIELSARFRSIREQTQLSRSHYEDKIRGIDTLRQALLQKAFSGELT